MRPGHAMTEWPFGKGLPVSWFLTSLALKASAHHSEQAWEEGVQQVTQTYQIFSADFQIFLIPLTP